MPAGIRQFPRRYSARVKAGDQSVRLSFCKDSVAIGLGEHITTTTYKMIGFDPAARFDGQDRWRGVLYAGDDGSILILLNAEFGHKCPAEVSQPAAWRRAEKAGPGDWYQLRQTHDGRNDRWYVNIPLRRDGTMKKKYVKIFVHHLVLWTWAGPRPGSSLEGRDGLHGNGNPSDNRALNLRWGTPAMNRRDQESEQNRRRLRERVDKLKGHKVVLKCDDLGEWSVDVFNRDERVDVARCYKNKMQSTRRSDPVRLLREALRGCLGEAGFTEEKWPVMHSGHRPCEELRVWIPREAFDAPTEMRLEMHEGQIINRSQAFAIGEKVAELFEYLVKD